MTAGPGWVAVDDGVYGPDGDLVATVEGMWVGGHFADSFTVASYIVAAVSAYDRDVTP